MSKLIFYKVLSYYDAYMIYECGLCDVDVKTDERTFLISSNIEVKKKMERIKNKEFQKHGYED